jgi:dolichyl-phosphate-mannose-protein mannosyltransferase
VKKFGWTFALVSIFFVSVLLRFWRVGFFNTLVFDEVYYPVFANRYLLGQPVYNAHPPLTQYLLTVGIWLGSHFPVGQEMTHGFLGSVRSTLSYRWLNAFTGAWIPVVVGFLAYQLTHRRSYGAIAALFAALDGLFLVESRFALNNIYLVLFGLLGHLFLFAALDKTSRPQRSKLVLSGVFFGLSAAIKWNGLGFLLGIYLVWAILWGWKTPRIGKGDASRTRSFPLQNLAQLNPLQILGYLGVIPAVTYCLSWIPHLLMNPSPGFWEMQQRILSFHQSVGSGPKVHPYCSPWYSWLGMWRPVAYVHQTARNTREVIPSLPPLTKGTAAVVYDVHAMGNPILWWLSTAAMVIILGYLLQRLWSRQWKLGQLDPLSGLAIYGLCNYGANLLPWLKVTRCTFIYHYMAASVFATGAIAWLVDSGLRSPRSLFRRIASAVIVAIAIGFIFWLPIFLGLPLSPAGYKMRMWFPHWI